MYKIVLALFAVVALVIAYDLPPDKREKIQEQTNAASAKCRETHNVPQDDMIAISKLKLPTSDVAHCYLKCMLEKFSVMENDKYTKDGFISAVSPYLVDDAQATKDAIEMATNCERIAGGDEPCEIALHVYACIYHETKRLGFTMPTPDP